MTPDMLATPGAAVLLQSLGRNLEAELPAKRPPLLDPQPEDSNVESYYKRLRAHARAARATPDAAAAGDLLQAGIWCLCQYVQQDLTGPVPAGHPRPLWAPGDDDTAAPAASAPGVGEGTLTAEDRWVARQLVVDGEDLLGRCPSQDKLLAALICLAEPLGFATTGEPCSSSDNGSAHAALSPQAAPVWAWWAARALTCQQSVLSGRSATLHTALQTLMRAVLAWAAGVAGVAPPAAAPAGGAGPAMQEQQASPEQGQLGSELLAAAHLEAALMQQRYGYVDSARQQLVTAGAALGVDVGISGAMGKRTVHQVDPKAQLVVRLGLGLQGSGAVAAAAPVASEQEVLLPAGQLGLDDPGLLQELKGMQDESDVFAAGPQLLEQPPTASSTPQQVGGPPAGAANGAGGAAVAGQLPLCGLEQALLLAWAAQVRKSNSQDELTDWQAAPYVEAVRQQQRSCFVLMAAARLAKLRHERARPRTRERALMAMEQLAAAVRAPSPPALPGSARLPFAFSTRFPLQPLLRKELAEHYVSLGVMGAALKVFEELEMWEQLITCYSLLGKKPLAQELINKRLQATPDDPKLWCALGDLNADDAAYEQAWQRSGQRSARAKRSLAHSALRRKEYANAAGHFEAALALSPLYPDSWFSLGYSWIKAGETDKALKAFSKATQLEPSHAEAWNNAAALWMQQARWREAFSCLAEATKYKRESWQAWENYASAGLRTGALLQAARGLRTVLQLTQGQRMASDMAMLLVHKLEEQAQALEEGGSGGGGGAQHVGGGGEESQGGPDDEEEGEEEGLQATEQLLGLLTLTGELRSSEGADGSAEASGSPAAASSGVDGVASARRQHSKLAASVGSLLKEAVNSPAATPALWGVLGRWHSMQGNPDSAKEAWLKEVRGLQGGPFSSDRDAWAAMAGASQRLTDACLQLHARSPGSTRELAAARMHLRGVLRLAQERFGESEEYQGLSELLERVTALEAEAKAQAQAAAA